MSDLRMVWIDLEMTGLDVDKCVIVEIGAIITGDDLKPLAEYGSAIWQPEAAINGMDAFVRDMHTKTGLLNRIRAEKTTLAQAEQATLELVKRFAKPREAVMAGNSIHQDRRFIAKYMPTLDAYMHYRQVDVSSLKVLAAAWFPGLPKFEKKKAHSAVSDIHESLAELAYYRAKLFKTS